MLVHSRSIHYKVFNIWRNPGRFTKNPDIIALSSGRMLLIYSDTDRHWSEVDQTLTLLASDDSGRTWNKYREIAHADLREGDERLVTPRLSLLEDGRLVVIIDQDDYGHFHEEQPPGILAFWSEDEGDTWTGPQETGIPGFEPDRMMDLPDGSLAVVTQYVKSDSQEIGLFLYTSEDRGKTWSRRGDVLHDGFYSHCEGALILLNGGKELAVVAREDQSAGTPSFAAFSQDMGYTWSAPGMLPFSFHRPYAKQLRDGRVLVTGRNMNGGLGCYAWCGDLKKETGCRAGGPPVEYTALLTTEAGSAERVLTIENEKGHLCRYSLLPPESSKSEVTVEAVLKAEGPENESVAMISLCRLVGFQGPVVLYIGSRHIAISPHRYHDVYKRIDMTTYKTVRMRSRRGLLEVSVDGTVLIRGWIRKEEYPLGSLMDYKTHLHARSMFGQLGETGKSHWKRFRYEVHNPTHADYTYEWTAESGTMPDEYNRTRLIQIHGNDLTSKPWPDHGYSSWLQLEDGRVFFVDYTNFGDEPGLSHLVGVYIDMKDIS